MTFSQTVLALGAAGVALGATALAPVVPATAADPARSRVTFSVDDDNVYFYGTLASPRPGCRTGRRVFVREQVGTRGGGDDLPFGSVLVEETSGRFGVWDLALDDDTDGRFYARVRATARCKADSSRTLSATYGG